MLYEFDSADKTLTMAEQMNAAQVGLLEKDLKNFLADLLASDGEFMTIFQERNFQPEPDLITLDANGNLIIMGNFLLTTTKKRTLIVLTKAITFFIIKIELSARALSFLTRLKTLTPMNLIAR